MNISKTPWTVERWGSLFDVRTGDASHGPHGRLVADMLDNEADAHLIAAAPELLEVLQGLVAAAERTPCTCDAAYTGRGLTDTNCHRCNIDVTDEELDAARAAIAKATGAES